MLAFFITLTASLLASALLLVLLAKRLKINWTQRNRVPVAYLLPVLFAAVFTILSVQITLPMILDSIAIVAKTCPVEEITPAEGAIHGGILIDQNRVFTFNRWQQELEVGQRYLLTYTPHRRFILEVQRVAAETDKNA